MKAGWVEPRLLDDDTRTNNPLAGVDSLLDLVMGGAIVLFLVLFIGIMATVTLTKERDALRKDAAMSEARDSAIIALPKQLDLLEQQVRGLQSETAALRQENVDLRRQIRDATPASSGSASQGSRSPQSRAGPG